MSRFQIYCQYCGTSKIVSDKKDITGLKEIPRKDVPGGVPYYDHEKKQIVEKKTLPQAKMFKCPTCGRGVIVKKYLVELPGENKESNDENKFNGREDGFTGLPISRETSGGFDERYPEIPK